MNDKLQEERELFEELARQGSAPYFLMRNPNKPDRYHTMRTQHAWEGFQMAYAALASDAQSELNQIHDVVMCIGCVTEVPESDPYTLREVKRMALRLNAQRIASDAQPQAPKVPDTAEPVATIVTDRYGVYVKDLRWLKKLDLPDGDYPLYLAPPSTAQAVEAALRKAAHACSETEAYWPYDVAKDALADAAERILDLIPTGDAEQVERDAKDAEILAALQQAHMALIGYLPSHRNAVTNAAIEACAAAIDSAKREG